VGTDETLTIDRKIAHYEEQTAATEGRPQHGGSLPTQAA